MNRKAYSRMTIWLTAVLASVLLLPSNVSAASWKEKVLYSFQGGPDGQTPQGGVVFDQQGNLYGTTINGGVYGGGAAYQLSPPAKKGEHWTESLVYSFQGKPVNDGMYPIGNLSIDDRGMHPAGYSVRLRHGVRAVATS
jgi:hypothetical protein